MAHLEIHGVSVALGHRDVVREVSAQVDAGELVVVVGPNGAGKTTLLRAIGGLVEPRAGTIHVGELPSGAVRGAGMSGFLTGRAGRLTARRLAIALGICAAVTAACALIAPLVGIVVDRAGSHLGLMGPSALDPGSPDHTILWALRVPRVLAALVAGAALAGAGCALQALLRNPLAESLLVGAAIAVVGPIGFIGLIVPHALRALLGPDHRLLVVASMFGGAAVLTVCDTLARTVVPLHHLPTGAVTSVLGVPFFIAILVGQKQRAALWGRG